MTGPTIVSQIKSGEQIITLKKTFKRKGIKFWCYYIRMKIKALIIVVLEGERNEKNRNS